MEEGKEGGREGKIREGREEDVVRLAEGNYGRRRVEGRGGRKVVSFVIGRL